jgi:hypothetical protein
LLERKTTLSHLEYEVGKYKKTVESSIEKK